MALNEKVFGEMDDDGKIVRDVNICALTGLNTGSGDVFVPILNTRHFFRIKGSLNNIPDAKESVEDMYIDQIKET